MSKNKIYNNRYEILDKIGSGSFGEVHLGEDMKTKNKIAIKLEDINSDDPRLRKEYEIYRYLENVTGISPIHWFGMDSDNRVLIMDYIGPSLEDIVKHRSYISTDNMMKISLKIIDLIENLHSRNIIHRDIKPENFLINKNNQIYIIDFGLSKLYKNLETKEHIPYSENNKLTGTPRYASINNHNGIEQSRRDDIEAIGYMLVYIIKKSLPWQGLKKENGKYQNILDKKINIPLDELCKDIPEEFKILIEYARKLNFYDTPNYVYLKSIFYKAIKDRKYT